MNTILPGGRWAVEHIKPRSLTVTVHYFWTVGERDSWVAQNPRRREAVGVRNPHVKAYRNRLKEGKP